MKDKTKEYFKDVWYGFCAIFILLFIFIMWWSSKVWQFMNWIHDRIKARMDAKR